ncbi:hypothetical protein BU23DRAFT_574070 [Bimuria novae-zelandiae CBS 107.79]|uniref:Uncharacterized protein n=1 Tax=Bimuria novae-zelandiae CBS 107.79 TaxID=1447943 RepID=A0A6A5UP49_9PLEO|nr:hypothetical protein BU23DRAFT_574070 [Bimuria novae-zelandiae CBS 107.79]
MKFFLVLFAALLSAVTGRPSAALNVDAEVDAQPNITSDEGTRVVEYSGDVGVPSSDGSEWSKREVDSELAKRALMTVTVYQRVRGSCPRLADALSGSDDLGGNPTWNDQITSFKVEPHFWCCFYINIKCSGGGFHPPIVGWETCRFDCRLGSNLAATAYSRKRPRVFIVRLASYRSNRGYKPRPVAEVVLPGGVCVAQSAVRIVSMKSEEKGAHYRAETVIKI